MGASQSQDSCCLGCRGPAGWPAGTPLPSLRLEKLWLRCSLHPPHRLTRKPRVDELRRVCGTERTVHDWQVPGGDLRGTAALSHLLEGTRVSAQRSLPFLLQERTPQRGGRSSHFPGSWGLGVRGQEAGGRETLGPPGEGGGTPRGVPLPLQTLPNPAAALSAQL